MLRNTLVKTNVWKLLQEAWQKNKIKSITATLRYATTSEKKINLIAKIIRWKKVNDALNILMFTNKKAAKILEKVLKSAIANAKHNLWLKEDDLYIKRIDIWRWPKIKRIRFASRARIHPYEKHRSFVRIVLDTNIS